MSHIYIHVQHEVQMYAIFHKSASAHESESGHIEVCLVSLCSSQAANLISKDKELPIYDWSKTLITYISFPFKSL